MGKNKIFEAGADKSTPSIPQYFSWINNTNEGSTEEQTIINLEFFKWLRDRYGMQIKIYAWDAGNFDGAGNGYGDENCEKFKMQYPRGYAPVVEKAKDIGIRLGLWGGPDGFGNTPEEEKKRYDFMVKLCRDYNFALFKLDGVCGHLREEKAPVFADMLRECRKYCPDLITLNHRLKLFGAEKYMTTFLWQGAETYTDIFGVNTRTCMHHRGYMFERGLPENLERLAEDHGVCLSSALDYFEDELIIQAFGRCMILAPEIYGNPWFLKDEEFPMLARIYNLHKKAAPILVDGMAIGDKYGADAVSRGNEKHRFITTGNNSWKTVTIDLPLDETVGISADEELLLIQRHPTEKLIGKYKKGDSVKLELLPFRAHLFEIATESEVFPYTEGEYRVITENENGEPVEILPCKATEPPAFITSLCDAPEMLSKARQLYEKACFDADNDSLEARVMKRSGETEIPQVKAARDAFFSQKAYTVRGCEGRAVFDGREDTFFDGRSKTNYGGWRVDGGCLRVDFGEVYDADRVEIISFAVDEPFYEVAEANFTANGEYSENMAEWKASGKVELSVEKENFISPVIIERIHTFTDAKGKLMKAVYPVGKLRYFALPEPMDRIYSIKVFKDGNEISLVNPKVNNLLAPWGKKTVAKIHYGEIILPEVNDGDYIAVALNGEHGIEGAYCVAEIDGVLSGFPSRACDYPSNVWEHKVAEHGANYTYYLPVSKETSGKKVGVYTLLCNEDKTDVVSDVYLCRKHI